MTNLNIISPSRTLCCSEECLTIPLDYLQTISLGPLHQFMVAVFCQPDNVTSWDQSLQEIELPNQASSIKTAPHIFYIRLLLVSFEMLHI